MLPEGHPVPPHVHHRREGHGHLPDLASPQIERRRWLRRTLLSWQQTVPCRLHARTLLGEGRVISGLPLRAPPRPGDGNQECWRCRRGLLSRGHPAGQHSSCRIETGNRLFQQTAPPPRNMQRKQQLLQQQAGRSRQQQQQERRRQQEVKSLQLTTVVAARNKVLIRRKHPV